MPEKGKPFERTGRKAAGLRPENTLDMAAGLPGEHGTSFLAAHRRRLTKEVACAPVPTPIILSLRSSPDNFLDQ